MLNGTLKLLGGEPEPSGCFVWKLPRVILSNMGDYVSHRLEIITPISECERMQEYRFITYLWSFPPKKKQTSKRPEYN